ncbi:MAG TPA: M48 family metalloprotease [Steroidobacteraceae bacterium]|nr:M48 family metalloprotease [Steroidobacteraceae bacterium]
MIRKFIVASAAAFAVVACASNPATGGHNVVFTSVKSEQEGARREHEEIIQFYGLYQDQAVQDYVQAVGSRVAAQTPIANWNFKFFVLDDDEVNAFTPGGGYVYIHRGLMQYLNSEAELAAVLGHEIGHDVARHPARAQTRGLLMSIGAIAAAVATGSEAIAEMTNLGATAWMQGYGRDNETEADHLGLEYATKAGYRPEAMAAVARVLKAQESFELQRAKDEGREANIYHGVFSDHPAPDDRVIAAVKGAAKITTEPQGGWVDNRETYLQAIDGLPFGSSREQGIVRDNRFYHADMKLTMAFPKGWVVNNLHDRLIVYTKKKDALMQVTIDKRPDKKSPREFLLEKLKGASFSRGEELSVDGMEGYSLVTRSGSPLDGGEGPIRWAVLYREKSVFIIGGTSRSSAAGAPIDDGLFMGSIQTMRRLRPSEFPLAQPYRVKVIPVTETTRLEEYTKDIPLEKFKKEELELLNGLYPNRKPKPGDSLKVVE